MKTSISKRIQDKWMKYYPEAKIPKKSLAKNKYLRGKQKDLVKYKADRGCSICGESDSACLEFHHLIPSEKSFNINLSEIKSHTNKEIQSEIAKCVVLCSNCHRKFHAGTIVVLSFRPLILQP